MPHVPSDHLEVGDGTKLTAPFKKSPTTNQFYSSNNFSEGPRKCLGERFAMLQIKVVMAKLLLNFQLLPTDKTRMEDQKGEIFFYEAFKRLDLKLAERE